MFIFYEFLFEMPREALFIMLCYVMLCYNIFPVSGCRVYTAF